MCSGCGQSSIADGGIGCVCGQVRCRVCGFHTPEKHGPLCFLCKPRPAKAQGKP
jgi:hypothetical protein